MRVEIDRSKWVCGGGLRKGGHGLGSTVLLNSGGFMCCLGFRCLAAGLRPEDILGVAEPGNLLVDCVERHWEGLKPLIDTVNDGEDYNSGFALKAVSLNDRSLANGRVITRADREESLQKLAARYGEEWVFVGEYLDEQASSFS